MGGTARMLPFARGGGGSLGAIEVPGSKSVAARVLVLAAQAEGVSGCTGLPPGEDTRNLLEALRTLGFPIQGGPEGCRILGGAPPIGGRSLELGASGAALRFLLPWLALECCEPVTFTGVPRLFERPLGPLLEVLGGWGARWEPGWGRARLTPCTSAPSRIEVDVEASLSSQFLSGLALACVRRPGGARMRWHGTAASPSYLTLTAAWMARFGCPSELNPGCWDIPPRIPRPVDLRIPGDWSGAAAFLCAASVLGASVDLEPLDPEDAQGDRHLLDILGTAGAEFHWEGDCLHFTGALERGVRADLSACPDLAPVLMATAALAPGPSRLEGLSTLRHKECDRMAAGVDLVRWLGGEAVEWEPGAVDIRPGPAPGPREPFDPRGDHRMAFAAAVGALRCGGALLDPACVAKTHPAFWHVWEAMLEPTS